MMEPPSALFKYVAPARVDIIGNERIAFTPPERFNDVLDVRPNVKPITSRQYLRQIEKQAQDEFVESLPPSQRPKNQQQRERLLEFLNGGVDHVMAQAPELAMKWQEELPKLISQHFGILCFSEINDSHQMWAHYASDHRGFVIEVDTAVTDFLRLGQLRKVEYLPSPPVYDAAIGAMGFWHQKLDHWAYEHEWRIVRELKECEQINAQNTPIYLCAFPLTLVKSICFGVRTSTETEHQIRTLVKGTHVRLYRALAHVESGKLLFNPV